MDGLRKVTFKGKRVEICMYNTIYMHIDIKVIFDPSTLSYMESDYTKHTSHARVAITVEGKNGRRDIERVTKKIGYWLLGSWALISQQLTGFFTVIHSIPRE